MATKALPEVSIGGTPITCLQGAQLLYNGTDISYHCAGNILHIAGPEDVQLTFSVALDNDDTTTIGLLAYGSQDSMEFHPGGDTATYIEHLTTNATIVGVTHNASPGSAIILDVTARWDDLTSQAAAA